MIGRKLYWSAYAAWHSVGQGRYPYRSLHHILRDQSARIQRVVAYAYTQVPYYRETLDRLGLRPGDFTAAADLSRLPLITPSQLQRDPEHFAARGACAQESLSLCSAGSTGVPRTCVHDAAAIIQTAAHGQRERHVLAGILQRRFGFRETKIIPIPSSTLLVEKLWWGAIGLPPGLHIRRQVLSLLDTPVRNVRLMSDFAPDVLYTYGSYLEMMFAYLRASGAPFHHPRVIVYSSAGVSPALRGIISGEYGIPLLSSYQAVEAIKLGFECEAHTGQHLNIDLYPLRIVDDDGRDLPPGCAGRVVVSNLVNRATVLLNYLLGDVAEFLPDKCPCGRTLPLLSFPMGRSDDVVNLPTGRQLHPQALCALFRKEPLIWQYQIVQEGPGRFVVRLLAAPECNRAETTERLKRAFGDLLGPGVGVEVAYVDRINPLPGGKYRAVIALKGANAEEVAHGQGEKT